MTRQYELMLVLRPDIGVEEKAIAAAVQKLLGARKTDAITVLGKKQLAYPIKKFTEGVYVVVNLSGEAMRTGEIEKQAKLGTDILRYLLTAKE